MTVILRVIADQGRSRMQIGNRCAKCPRNPAEAAATRDPFVRSWRYVRALNARIETGLAVSQPRFYVLNSAHDFCVSFHRRHQQQSQSRQYHQQQVQAPATEQVSGQTACRPVREPRNLDR